MIDDIQRFIMAYFQYGTEAGLPIIAAASVRVHHGTIKEFQPLRFSRKGWGEEELSFRGKRGVTLPTNHLPFSRTELNCKSKRLRLNCCFSAAAALIFS
jgi:hypothetical protein